jgi:hypothetical protein
VDENLPLLTTFPRKLSFLRTFPSIKSQESYLILRTAKWHGCPVVVPHLAEKVADMSATCRPDSQMSALLAKMPLSRRHNFDPDTFFCVGICRHPPKFPL